MLIVAEHAVDWGEHLDVDLNGPVLISEGSSDSTTADLKSLRISVMHVEDTEHLQIGEHSRLCCDKDDVRAKRCESEGDVLLKKYRTLLSCDRVV